jgi:mannose-6-phosphate isomerase class I
MDFKPKFEGLRIEKYKSRNITAFGEDANRINKLLLCFILEGKLNLHINSQLFPVEKDSIIMLPPDTELSNISGSEKINFIVFYISLDFISTYSFLEVLWPVRKLNFNLLQK